ncbi:MAG: FtsW/RodA/SpoVE family cell cycle protein, partial [Clostridia bacterium]|nr:FtsW/RodA/SpoVE family cell cycle protein [Clostridia bacterium]
EELGFVGALILIALFVFLLYRGLKIAKNAPDLFGTLMATGFVVLVIIQAAMNIAVVTASIPATGIPLPFFSYGGTAIVVTMAELGIVMNVSRQSKMLL